ncbi:MAG: hypothetical protein HQK65_14320 [Desulfamplus sp.]|nr:hypothetical protein [Desulfamplus sp.]
MKKKLSHEKRLHYSFILIYYSLILIVFCIASCASSENNLILSQNNSAFSKHTLYEITTPEIFIVSGVKNETNDSDWNNRLIAQGIVNLISEELFKTGKFIPLEDTPEILTQIQQLSEYIWDTSDNIKISQANEKARSFGSNIIVYGIIKKIKKSRTRTFAGPFSASEVVISVEIELTLNKNGQMITSARGTGKGITKSKSVIFRVWKDKINFDETSVGKAVYQAVQEAVQKLILK